MLGNDIESVKSVVRTAIDPENPPSRSQVLELCRLTYFDEARKEIQRVIVRRLKYPYSYQPLEVLHTIQLLENCFSNGSLDFITFCVAQAQLIGSLEDYESGGIPIAQEIASNARLLSKRLTESLPPSDKHKEIFGSTTSRSISFRELRPDSTKRKKFQTALWTIPSLISPGLYQRHEKTTSIFQPDNIKLETSASVLLLQKEDVAAMTFQSGNEGLDATLNAVDELIFPVSPLRSHPDELVKALKCVLHCLYWGSAPFTEKCREKKKIFSLLCQHSNPKVRGYANEVFTFLSNDSPIQEEELSRLPLIIHSSMPSSIPNIPTHSKVICDFVLDPSLDISGAVKAESGLAKGLYHTTTGKLPVWIKYLRKPGTGHLIFHKRLNDELLAWRTLSHKNVTPFYGVILEDNAIGLVWPVYPDGNVLEYLNIYWNIDPLHMLQGIADGLLYLHAKGIVHGDIRSGNVLVGDDGTPCLTNFRPFEALDGLEEKTGYSGKTLASLRWSAPEIWISVIGDSPISSKTEKSDIYAFASTCLEVITHEAPYQGFSDQQVLEHVAIDKKFPARPSLKVKYLTNDLWGLLTTCWSPRPQDRPNIVALRRKLAEIIDSHPRNAFTALTRKKRFQWPTWIDRAQEV